MKRRIGHFYDQDIKRGYNDANPTTEDLVQEHGSEDKGAVLPTLNRKRNFTVFLVTMILTETQIDWHARGGLVGRGVLIDYKAYADRNGIKYSPFEAHKVTITAIEEIAREQGIVFQQGDIFLLRTGYTEAIEAIEDVAEQERMGSCPDSAGVEDTMMAVKWFWNNHFSAVAADNVGFEVMRPTVNGVSGSGTTADYGKPIEVNNVIRAN